MSNTNSIQRNYPHLDKVVLQLLSDNDKFKQKFEIFAPEVHAEIQTFVANPNCVCKAKISEYANANKDKCADFINQFLLETSSFVDLSKISKQAIVDLNPISGGKMKKIKKSEWATFQFENSRSGGRGPFISFSIIPVDDEHIEVYYV